MNIKTILPDRFHCGQMSVQNPTAKDNNKKNEIEKKLAEGHPTPLFPS
jgi:hypothetical protein